MLAVSNKRLGIVRLLLKCGADVNLVNNFGKTALFYADAECAELLINNNASLNVYTYWNASPLMEAVTCGDIHKVIVLLKHGADVNLLGKRGGRHDGSTALLLAIHACSNIQIIKLLLKHGANVNVPDRLGITAFIKAVMYKRMDIALLLKQHGADMDKVDNNGNSALTIAWRNSHADGVYFLLFQGVITLAPGGLKLSFERCASRELIDFNIALKRERVRILANFALKHKSPINDLNPVKHIILREFLGM
jgi:ankyrin repeat protein